MNILKLFIPVLPVILLMASAVCKTSAQSLVIVPPQIDTVIVGETRSENIKIINRGTSPIQIQQISLLETSGSVRLSGSSFAFMLNGRDSISFTMQITPRTRGIFRCNFMVQGSESASAEFSIVARFRNNSEFAAEIRPSLRVSADTVSPGDYVWIELYLAGADNNTLRDLLRVTQSPSFTAVFSCNGNLLQTKDDRVVPIEPTPFSSYTSGTRAFRIITLPGSASPLFTFIMQAMAGDAEQTEIVLNSFQWGSTQALHPVPVNILPPINSRVFVKNCTAGGKRLFTSAPDTRIALHNTFPNPASSHVDIAYSLQEAQPVTLALYNAQGNFIRAMKSEYHEAGEYTERVAISDLATGTYFVRLQGTNGVQQKAVSVVR